MNDFQWSVDWFTTEGRPETFRRVVGHMGGMPRLRLLEIGSYEGRSAVWWCRNMATHTTSKVVCVDAWRGGFNPEHTDAAMDEVERRFDHNTRQWTATQRIEKRKGASTRLLAEAVACGERYHVVYVDGDHHLAQAACDMCLAWELVLPGGYMIIDDYGSQHHNHKNMKQTVDAWLAENPEAVVMEEGYQVIVRRNLPRILGITTEPDPVFYAQVYRDGPRLDWALGHLREHYPRARVYIISDGDDETNWLDICGRHGAEYYPGERLKLLENGGESLHRNLGLFVRAPGTHLVKFDTDTKFHRRFYTWPGEPGVYGTVQCSDAEPKIRSLQGGCWVFTAGAVAALAGGVLQNPLLRVPATWSGDRGTPGAHAAATGCISEDFVLAAACGLAGVPMREHPEIVSGWKTVPHGAENAAVTHPHKQGP